MWSNSLMFSPLYQADSLSTEYLHYRVCFSRRLSLNYKNRSLAHTFTAIDKTANFFVFKGKKLKYQKTLLYANLVFFHAVNDTRIPTFYQKKYNFQSYDVNLIEHPLLDKLLSETLFFMDFNLLIPYFLTRDLPMIKPIISVKPFFKKKKQKNKNISKYNIRYAYVPHKQRIQVTMRWFSMVIKLDTKPMVNSFLNTCLDILNEDTSFIVRLRNQIYLKLAAEKQ